MTRQYKSEEELHQADLSELELKDMTPEEQREMKRRFDDFANRLGKRVLAEARADKQVAHSPRMRAWVPPRARNSS